MLFTLVYSTPFACDINPGTTAAAYTAGKCMGTLFTVDVRSPIRSGENGPIILVESLVLSDAEKIDGDIDLVLFDSIPTAVVNNATFAPSAADLEKIAAPPIRVRGSATPSDWSDFSANSVAGKAALAVTIRAKTPPNLWGLFIARSAITFAGAASLKGKLTGFVN